VDEMRSLPSPVKENVKRYLL